MTDDHREKAVEAVARQRFERGRYNPDGIPWREVDARRMPVADELRDEVRQDFAAADPHLRCAHFEEFREAVMGYTATQAAADAHCFTGRAVGGEIVADDEDRREQAMLALDAALDKAQELLEGDHG